jgi:hypothetical protein
VKKVHRLLSLKLTVLVVLRISRVFVLGRRTSQQNGTSQVIVLGVGGLVLATRAVQIGGLGVGGGGRALLQLIKRLRRGRLGRDLEGNKSHVELVWKCVEDSQLFVA